MDKVKIQKAKIVDDLFLYVEYEEDLPGHSKKKNKLSSTVPIHDDLRDKFAKLAKHLAILCDGIAMPKRVTDIGEWESDEIKVFGVKSFSIGGNDEHEGITLSGSKEGTYGLVNLNSPFQKWEGSEYKHIGVLHEEIEACLYEVDQYLFNGKKAPEKQLDMFEEAEGIEQLEGEDTI